MFGNKSGRSSGQTVVDTLIGAQVVIRGDLMFSGGLYVEGRILGKVIAEEGVPAMLTLSEHGSIEGEIRAPVVVINGQMIGDVHATERVELAPKARVQGNVHYQVVEMNAGAQLTGCLIHAGSIATLALPQMPNAVALGAPESSPPALTADQA
ncbi:polymer-forming cytoskeletal protein [Xanthomonas sp. MUS 060]|uniref:bactofilin family protein n=1 Tax=Xanthomonas sp. MUS 060 TaxID=1588031 RepID=UPI0005F2BC31|nr:polymer-forming cytoskeletal protein [Xanthomonas sp. MUS 060]